MAGVPPCSAASPRGLIGYVEQGAYLIGSIALAVILFDAGFGTRIAAFRQVVAPAITLSTLVDAYGAVIDPAGDRRLCVARTHRTRRAGPRIR
jgi:hypothetical protein